MDEHTDNSSANAENNERTRESFSNILEEVSAIPEKISEMFQDIKEEVPPFKPKPSTWTEWFGGRLASRLLLFICFLAFSFLIAWWFTRPSLPEVQQILGPNAKPNEVLETFRGLLRDHFDQFRDLFQIIVLSGLVPLFTMLAGYAFGSKEKRERQNNEQKEEQEEQNDEQE
ncbi:hypothetical protein H8E77_41505 [bacterium]|nr:hypothetical protein [bacterium]